MILQSSKFKLTLNKNFRPHLKCILQFSKSGKEDEHVVIIGAGIIGVTSAIPLLEKGYKVTIIDREYQAAPQTSNNNGCLFSPYHFKPLVTMSNMMLFFKSWYSAQGNFQFNLNIMFEQNFWLCMTKKGLLVNSYRNLDVGEQSHQEYKRLRESYPEMFSNQKIQSRGQIGLFKDEKSLMDYKSILDEKNVIHEVVTNVQQLEKYHPDLVNSLNQDLLSQYYGGIVMPNETSIETGSFTRHAVKFLQQQFPDKFNLKLNCEAKNIIFSEANLATGIQTTQGDIQATQFVYATATHSRHLKQLNVRVPVLPVRGWTTGIPYNKLDFKDCPIPLPYHFNIFTGNMFCAPIDGQLRLSGIAHLIKVDPNNMDYWGSNLLIDYFNQLYKTDIPHDDCSKSQCYRPISPDDGPIIGRLPKYKNIFVNNGHGSKGLSHGFGAAKILCEVIEQGQVAEDKWSQFKLDRFYFI